jgi:restriction endonuclease S subunit
VPPLAAQHQIVNFLDEADQLRKLRAQADSRSAAFIPALFHEMFGNTTSIQSESVSLREVAEIKSGAGFPLNRQGLLDQAIPFFKVGDMNTVGNESEMHVFQHSISEATRKDLGAFLFPPGSVIFAKVGAAIGTNKKRVLVRSSCVDNNVMGIIPSDRVLTEFILALLSTKNLMEFASNSNPPSIRKTTVEGWQIPLPPLQIQKKFVQYVADARALQATQTARRGLIESLFQSMLHRAFSGGL